MISANSYLGGTLKYPITINEYGRPAIVTGIDTIPQSIEMILQTPKGSRFFLPEFGSDLQLLIFEPNDDLLKDLLYHNIYDALTIWEKRIKVDDILFNFKASEVRCEVQYTILKSNEVDSFIFPFYRELIY